MLLELVQVFFLVYVQLKIRCEAVFILCLQVLGWSQYFRFQEADQLTDTRNNAHIIFSEKVLTYNLSLCVFSLYVNDHIHN
jgi:hypothetical protein